MKVILLVAALLVVGAAVPPAQGVQVVSALCNGSFKEVCHQACDLLGSLPYHAVAGVIECLP